jgi:hypothetical protein
MADGQRIGICQRLQADTPLMLVTDAEKLWQEVFVVGSNGDIY